MQQQMDMTPDMAAALVRLRAACARPLDADERGNRARYASLSHIIETLSPILAEHGFAVLHSQASAGIVGERLETKSGRNGQSYEQQITLLDVTAVCRLVHESGGYVDSSYSTIVEAGRGINERDAIAGGYTNARRYSLLAACGVAVTQDDKAETLGSGAPVQAAPPTAAPAPTATRAPRPAQQSAPAQAAPPPAPAQAAPPPAQSQPTQAAPADAVDPLAEFLEACCVMGEECFVRASALYEAYVNWCDDEKVPVRERMTKNKLGRRVTALPDITKGDDTRKRRVYWGISLLTEREDDGSQAAGF